MERSIAFKMGYRGRKKNSEPSQADNGALFYFQEGTRQQVKRDWLEKHTFKSVSRDWNPGLWVSNFEPSRDYRL